MGHGKYDDSRSGSSYLQNLYENRGESSMKVGDLRSAVNDYTAASIGEKLWNEVCSEN